MIPNFSLVFFGQKYDLFETKVWPLFLLHNELIFKIYQLRIFTWKVYLRIYFLIFFLPSNVVLNTAVSVFVVFLCCPSNDVEIN